MLPAVPLMLLLASRVQRLLFGLVKVGHLLRRPALGLGFDQVLEALVVFENVALGGPVVELAPEGCEHSGVLLAEPQAEVGTEVLEFILGEYGRFCLGWDLCEESKVVAWR